MLNQEIEQNLEKLKQYEINKESKIDEYEGRIL
jgi:hypothetical protein